MLLRSPLSVLSLPPLGLSARPHQKLLLLLCTPCGALQSAPRWGAQRWAPCSRWGLPSAERREERLPALPAPLCAMSPMSPGSHWPSWPQNTLLACGQPLDKQGISGFLATRAHSRLVVMRGSTIGQPLANLDTSGLPCHRGTVGSWSAVGWLVNHWSTVGQPRLAFLVTRTPCWFVVTVQPLASQWSAMTPVAFLVTRTDCCFLANH